MKNILIIICCIGSLVSCDTGIGINSSTNSNFENLRIILITHDLGEKGEKIPEGVKQLLRPLENESCEKLTIINLDVFRIDQKEVQFRSIEVKDPGLRIGNFNVDRYNKRINSIKLTDELTKSGTEINYEHLNSSFTQEISPDLVYSVNQKMQQLPLDNFNGIAIQNQENIKEVVASINEKLCSDGNQNLSTIVVFYDIGDAVKGSANVVVKDKENEYLIEEDNLVNVQSEPNSKTVSEAFELKEALKHVIDANQSESERVNVSKQIWAEYFTSKAYVAKYNSVNDKNPDIWEPGQGELYLTGRLAILPSIKDFDIFRLEFDDNGKISGMKIVEYHNAATAY